MRLSQPAALEKAPKRLKMSIGAAILLVLAIWLLFILLANKAKGEYQAVFGDMQPINAQIICDNGQPETSSKYSYAAFFYTRKNPESFLVISAQKKGYGVSSDLALISSISKLSPAANRAAEVPYNASNFYLIGKKPGSELKIRIFQAGTARLWCKGSNWGRTIQASPDRPIVELEVTKI